MKQTQTQMILEDLTAGCKITPMIALLEYGCMRLAARIGDIELLGYTVNRRMIRVKTKRGYTHVAQYYI